MKPDEAMLEFVETFARALVARDFLVAHRALAPWLQARISPDDLAAAIDSEIRDTLEACGEREACQPRAFEIDWNSSTLDSLRADRSSVSPSPIPDEVTSGNFRKWLCVQFQPGEDAEWNLDAFFDLWMIVVELDTGLAIGYYEMLEAD